jgi:hypothetical protein
MGQKETVISELCKEQGIIKPTLYRYLAPNGALREYGKGYWVLLNRSVVQQPLTQAKFTVF